MDVDSVLRGLVESEAFSKPSANQKIYKDECAFCFKTPLWKDGLFISLKTYHAFCREHVDMYANLTGHGLFVQFESTKVMVDERADGEPTSKMTKLKIDADPKFEFDDKYSIVVHPNYTQQIVAYQGVPEVADTVTKIVSTTSAERLALLSSTSNAWDAEIKLITKHANLVQHDNGKRLPSSGWRCDVENCGLEENLWLNLTDGAIRCGRSQFVSEGVKTNGNGHMQTYYSETRYPLVVKLGTISACLDAIDVYSYDEDDAVIDPNITEHLAHFGLDPVKMEKTAKSTMEMELDMNEKWEYAKCTEDGTILEPIFGPGYTGLINTGSSCYMNSVLQAVLQVAPFRARFGEQALEILTSCPIDNVPTDFNAQFAKVVRAMLSGDYASETDLATNHVKPLQFKRVAAGNHPEFSTAKQQDVEEYIRFLFEKITANTASDASDPTDALRFQTWNRFEDVASSKVRYTEQEEVLLHLPIPEYLLTPINGSENRYSVEMSSAIKAFFGAHDVEGYKSPVTGEVKGATNTLTMKTFPDYLLVQVQKFAYTNAGALKKLDLDFEVSEDLDLTEYRGTGKKDSEEELPEETVAKPAVPEIPASVRAVAEQLMMMGFGEDACLKAAFYSNGNAEVATNWLMENIEDPTLNDKFVMPSGTPSSGGDVDAGLVASIVDMGFSTYQAKYALKQAPNVAEAIDWLFSNMDNIPAEGSSSSSAPEPSATGSSTSSSSRKKAYPDGAGQYKLIGMISHMGSRPDSGHYVAHMLKDGKWVLFNDEKVALSQDPPKKLAYVYLYQRV